MTGIRGETPISRPVDGESKPWGTDGTMARPPGSRERTTHPHSGVRGGTADKMVGGPMGMGAGLWPHPYGTACQGEREKGTAWERAE